MVGRHENRRICGMEAAQRTLTLDDCATAQRRAHVSAQAAKDSAAEAKARAEQEAAAGVAAGVEEALAEVRRMEEIKYEPAQDQAAEESEDDDNAEEEVIKFAFGFP